MVAQIEKKLAIVERARDSVEHKVEVLKGKVEKFDTKLAQALSVIMARDEELAAMKRNLEQLKQDNYDLGFDDVERSIAKVIKEVRLVGYLEGWVAALDAVHLPLTSLFRDLLKVPLLEDLPVEEAF